MHQLVVHEHGHALVGRDRLEREVERRDLDRHDVARHGAGRRVAGVGEISEQHRDVIGRRELEELLLERQRVEERARRSGDEVALGALEIDQTHLRCFDRRQLRGGAYSPTPRRRAR